MIVYFGYMKELKVKEEHLLKKKGLTQPAVERVLIKDLEVRKSLNQWGKLTLFGLYSLGIFALGGTYFAGSKISEAIDYERISNAQRDYINELNSSASLDRGLLAKKIREEVGQVIERESILAKDLLGKKELEIQRLRDELQKLRRGESLRTLSSVSSREKIPFSKANLDILFKEHRYERGELLAEQKRVESDFILYNDLVRSENQSLLSKLKYKHKVQLFELDKKHRLARQDFREKKYRIRVL